jgi:hypothetical protein
MIKRARDAIMVAAPSMKTRSPILGYNHNVRYTGRLWHVQTEDSGVQNPHVFTHLFHEGTILATKRLDYDPASDVPAVQKIMQTQHKAMLRELKAGAFDAKIEKFFGEPVVRGAEEESTDPNAQPPIALDLPSVQGPKTDPSLPVVDTRPLETTQPRYSAPPPASSTARPAMPRSTGGIGSRRVATASAAVNKPSAEGVVVARPAVIIGGEASRGNAQPRRPASQQVASVPAPAPPPPPQPKPSTNDNIFGADLISEKSLDEVILAYLSEDLNEK